MRLRCFNKPLNCTTWARLEYPIEFELMEKHCMIGKNIISRYEAQERDALRAHARLGQGILHIRNSPLMMMASCIAQTHHENRDGKGYPKP